MTREHQDPTEQGAAGRFSIVGALGEGAFGSVHQAYDRQRRRAVALKRLKAGRADDIFRFKQEFRALADISHPNLVAYYDLFHDHDGLYFTMELVHGVDFVQWVRGAPPPPPDTGGTLAGTMVHLLDGSDPSEASDGAEPPLTMATSWDAPVAYTEPTALTPDGVARLRPALVQLVRAVAAVHAAGKLHLDLKASNVLVTGEGRAVVLDFGLVRPTGEREALGAIVGTPAYMAPESFEGTGLPATDWYAVGAMLYVALAGRPAYEGTLDELVAAKAHPPQVDLPDGTPDDLARLCLDLLSVDPAVRPDAADILARLGADADPAASPTLPHATGAFVGRDRALTALRRARSRAARGAPSVVEVTGTSGTGKSALIDTFLSELTHAAPDTVVLRGRCYERESLPYKAVDSVIDALTSTLVARPRREVAAWMPADAPLLTTLFPVLAQVRAIAKLPAPPEPRDTSELWARAVAALRAILGSLGADRPLVVSVDDLQWGDAESARLLADVLAPPAAPPVLAVLSWRSEDAGDSSFVDAFERLAIRHDLARDAISLGDLSPEEAAELARDLFGDDPPDDETVAWIVSETGGNPFFIGELVEHVRASLGRVRVQAKDAASRRSALDDAVVDRVRHLDDGSQRILAALAVAGRQVPLRVVSLAAGTGDTDHLDEATYGGLRHGRLIRTQQVGGRSVVDTYHDRVREALLAHTDDDARKDLHRRLADAWRQQGDADDETLATHLEGAGDLDGALRHLVRAAARAGELVAFEHAASLWRHVLELADAVGADDTPWRTAFADVLGAAGRRREAAEELLALASHASGPAALDLRRAAAQHLLRCGLVDEGLAQLRDVLPELGVSWPAGRWRLVAALVWYRVRIGFRGYGHTRRARDEIPAMLVRRLDLLRTLTEGLRFIAPLDAALFQSLYVLDALEAGDLEHLASAMQLEAGTSAVPGEDHPDVVDELLQQSADLADELGDATLQAGARFVSGGVGYMSGDHRRTREMCEAAEALLRDAGRPLGTEADLSLVYLHHALWFLGDLNTLHQRIRTWSRDAERRDDGFARTWLAVGQHAVTRLLLTDDLDGYHHAIDRAVADWSQHGFQLQQLSAMRGHVDGHLYEGDGAAALTGVHAMWRPMKQGFFMAAQVGRVMGWEMRVRAELACAAQTAGTERRAHLRAARRSARQLRRTKARWARPLADLADAGHASIRGDVAAARAHLEAAMRHAEEHGMAMHGHLAARCHALLSGASSPDALLTADAKLRACGIVSPERATGCLAPGDWSAPPALPGVRP